MNFQDNSKKINSIDAIEVDEVASIDDFIRELEAKEKDLHLSSDSAVVEIEVADNEDDDLAELEKLLESYESNPPAQPPPLNPLPILTPAAPAAGALEKETANLRSALAKAEKERVEALESSKRRQSDFENFKKRIERERGETHRRVLSRLAAQLLPVVDNMERALNSASGHEAEKSADFRQFIEGIVLVNHQLNEVLEEIGVQPILAVGEPFDPHFHEAVETEPTDEVPPNTVLAELLRGYKIEENVIRPAMVKVSSASDPKTSAFPEKPVLTSFETSALLELE